MSAGNQHLPACSTPPRWGCIIIDHFLRVGKLGLEKAQPGHATVLAELGLELGCRVPFPDVLAFHMRKPLSLRRRCRLQPDLGRVPFLLPRV